ncbi:MAG: baseplate J/gp47 family protein, partial [Roseovarius sp.]
IVNVPFTTDADVTVTAGGEATVSATQGVVQYGNTGFGEFLGTSDGTPTQRFTLTTYEAVLDSLEIYIDDRVNEVAWERVGNYTEYGPMARVYEVFDNGQDETEVLFGDGVSGLVPPAGHFVLALYRTTVGSSGNVPAGSIRNIDDIPTLNVADLPALTSVLSVINDIPATGGVDPESTDSIRRSAPRAYRSFNRLVSLRDFEDASLSVPNCGKASSESTSTSSVVIAVAPYRDPRTAELTPGIDNSGVSPAATLELDALKTAVQNYLDSIKLVGTSVAVVNPIYVPIEVELNVTLLDNVRQVDAEALITEAIAGRFDYTDVPFGAQIYPADLVSLVTTLGDLADNVTVVALHLSGGSGVDTITAELDEILVLSPAAITLNLTGGIE